MAPLWTAKPSPGKGTGVFATRTIPSGTHILHDTAAMFLKDIGGLTYRAAEQTVFRKVRSLVSTDQAKFYALHEGPRKFATREMRIYKANVFGNGDDEWLFFDVSRFNHSCVPNAELATSGDGEKTPIATDVYATRDIAADEEIFISYHATFDGATRSQRRQLLRVMYGFDCQCVCCATATEEEVRLSDARRQVIHDLLYKFRGEEAPPLRFYEELTAEIGESPQDGYGHIRRLRTPLTRQQELAFRVLYTAAREAEGLGGVELAVRYQDLVELLLGQILDEEPIIVLESAKQLQLWMLKASEAWRRARGTTKGGEDDVPTWKLRLEKAHPFPMFKSVLRQPLQRPRSADGTLQDIFALELSEVDNRAMSRKDIPRGRGLHVQGICRDHCLAQLRKMRGKTGEQRWSSPARTPSQEQYGSVRMSSLRPELQ